MANFLDSQKALSEANAAAAQAKAEIDKINAEIAKIQAEQAKILAEAQAKINEAYAAQEEAKAEMERAKVEAYINGRKAELDRYIGETENAINWANLSYEKAVYAWEQQKIKDANAFKSELYQAVAAQYVTYLEALKGYNGLNARLLEEQRKYAQWANDLVYDPQTHKFTLSPKYNFEKYYKGEVANYEKEISNIQSQINEYTTFAEKLQDITKSDLYATLESYEKKSEANKLALDQAVVKRAELEVDNMDKRKEWEAANEKVTNLKKQNIDIAAYTIPSYPNIPGFEGKDGIVVVLKDVTYSLEPTALNYSNYSTYENEYRGQIARIENALLDDNDKAWTQARINEMKTQLTAANTEYATAKANWQIAKKVYNNGKTPDASVLPNEAEIETALNNYNALAEKYNSDVKDRNSKWETYDKANQAYWDAYNKYPSDPNSVVGIYNAAQETYNKAYQKAWSEYWTASDAADEAYNQAEADAQQLKSNAWAAYYRANDAAFAAEYESNLDPENETLKKAAETARETADGLYTKAEEADTKYDQTVEKAESDKNKAFAKANTARIKAINDAKETLEKAKTAYIAAGGDKVSIDPTVKAAREAMEEADKAYQEAQKVVNEASEPINKALANLEEAISTQRQEMHNQYKIYWQTYEFYNEKSDIENILWGYVSNKDLPTLIAPAYYQNSDLRYYNAYSFIYNTSRNAYGDLATYDVLDGDYSNYLSDYAFLVDEVTPDMVNDYIIAYAKHNQFKDLEPYQYYTYYRNRFGLYGNVLYLENRIETGEAYLANTDDINDLTKTLQENLATLEKSKKDQEALITDAEKAAETAKTAYDNVFVEIDDQIGSLAELNSIYGNILLVCKWTVADLASRGDVPANIKLDPKTQGIKNAIDLTNGWIKSLNDVLAQKQESLAQAKNQLEIVLNNGDLYNVNPYEIKVNDLKAELEAAKIELDLHKAHLEELQAAYDAASSKNAE